MKTAKHQGIPDETVGKSHIHALFIERLASQVEEITAAAKAAFATATDREHKARNKYDTFGLEASYLARGQAQRVEDLTEALARLRAMPLRSFAADAPIQTSALVEVENADGTRDLLFLVGAGGGEELTVDGRVIRLVTPSSPLGQALLGKQAGDSVPLRVGTSSTPLRVLSVR